MGSMLVSLREYFYFHFHDKFAVVFEFLHLTFAFSLGTNSYGQTGKWQFTFLADYDAPALLST